MLPSTLTPFLYCGAQNCMLYSRWGYADAKYSERIISLWLSSCAVVNAPHNAVYLLGCQGTLQAHTEPAVTSTPTYLSAELLSSHFFSRFLHLLGLCFSFFFIILFLIAVSVPEPWRERKAENYCFPYWLYWSCTSSVLHAFFSPWGDYHHLSIKCRGKIDNSGVVIYSKQINWDEFHFSRTSHFVLSATINLLYFLCIFFL